MLVKSINYKDIRHAALNSQYTVRGTAINIADSNLIFAILSVDGSTVTLKNAAGTTITIVSNKDYRWPLLLEGGFQATSGSDSTITYCTFNKL